MFVVKIEQSIGYTGVVQGLDVIAKAAAKAYGGGNIISMDVEGRVICSDKMKDLITNGSFENLNAEYVRQLIAQKELPEDGLKTAVLLANEFLQTGYTGGIDKQDFLDGVNILLKTATEKLQEIAKANGENLPGGGMYLLNICRPVMRMFEKGVTHPSCQKFIYALEKPFLILAENAGCEPHGAFASIKAVAPNQYYSLRQFGLEEGHVLLTEHRDLWRMGINLKTGRVTDMMEEGITVPLNIALSVMETVQTILSALCTVRSAL